MPLYSGASDVPLAEQLDKKLDELKSAFAGTVATWVNPTGFYPGIAVVQDILGAESNIARALNQTYKTLTLLEGDLYAAVLGNHVFPLDDGPKPNPPAALASWNMLATDVQDTLAGVLGYVGKWGPLPGLIRAATSPTLWPWWLQGAAFLVIGSYALKGVAFVGRARSDVRAAKGAFSGYQRRRR